MIAICHPGYLALTDGECGVPHSGVSAYNDIRDTMRPDTHFSVSIQPGHRFPSLLDPSPPLISAHIFPFILMGDKVRWATIFKPKTGTNRDINLHTSVYKIKTINNKSIKSMHLKYVLST